MASLPIDCPYCGRKIGTVNSGMNASGTKVCPGCKIRIRYDYDKRTGHLSAGKAQAKGCSLC